MNDEDINLEIKVIEFRRQKQLESEVLARAKIKRQILEEEKRELFRKKMTQVYDVFLSSFKYSVPIGISQMAILHSIAIFPIIHFGVVCYRLKNWEKIE